MHSVWPKVRINWSNGGLVHSNEHTMVYNYKFQAWVQIYLCTFRYVTHWLVHMGLCTFRIVTSVCTHLCLGLHIIVIRVLLLIFEWYLLVLQLIWLLHLQRHANWRWVCLMLMCMDHLYLPWWGFMESRKWVKVRLYYYYCILFRVISLSFYIIAFCIQGHPILARITNSNWMNYHVQLYELYYFHARS